MSSGGQRLISVERLRMHNRIPDSTKARCRNKNKNPHGRRRFPMIIDFCSSGSLRSISSSYWTFMQGYTQNVWVKPAGFSLNLTGWHAYPDFQEEIVGNEHVDPSKEVVLIPMAWRHPAIQAPKVCSAYVRVHFVRQY